MNPIYDAIGINYSISRKEDPKIAKQILDQLAGAGRIVNIGAGTGSYEPKNIDLVAVEPSSQMIAQRSPDAHQVVQAFAEELPFEDNTFSHALTVLSMHHWSDRSKAFAEINRVATDKFVAITWNPEHGPFWLTRDYLPEIYEQDLTIFPKIEEFENHFKEVKVSPLTIPENCQDGFLAAFWKRPEAYLDKRIRQSISTFAKLKGTAKKLDKLKKDLDDGTWHKQNKAILNKSNIDAGYVIVSAKIIN